MRRRRRLMRREWTGVRTVLLYGAYDVEYQLEVAMACMQVGSVVLDDQKDQGWWGTLMHTLYL